MEEKYTFKEKQKVIYHMIKKKLYKEHISHLYQNLEIKKESDLCFNCLQQINNNSVYCSTICQNIFESNLYKNNLYINCIPFSLLNLTSRNKLLKIINNNILYDKVQIFYKYDISVLDYNKFKKLSITIIFIHNYRKILEEKLTLETNIFKTDDTVVSTFIKSLSIPTDINKELPDTCLYCNSSDVSYYIHLTNNYILGRFCSKFCSIVYLSVYEQHTRQPYKYFLNLPPIHILKDKNIIEKFKKKNNNNTTIYNTIFTNNNKINIVELIY
jgi:hypothetical protein